MIYHPASIEQLTQELICAGTCGEQSPAFDLAALNRVIEYNPADMTVTVETGLTLAVLQRQLAERGQWLPIDPPNPHTATIADILNNNTSGPHRFGYGTIREHLLGLTVALADGRLIHSGGKVVKNVAGYDLCKLFVGSCGTLGVMVEASFKVLPVPEAEQIVAAPCESLAHAAVLLEQIQQSELTPVVLDLTSVAASRHCSVVLALAGTREEVDWQLGKAVGLGLSTVSDLEYERSFWSATEAAPPHRISVLPSRLTEVLQNLEAFHFVARAGNGVVYYRGGKAPPEPELPRALMQRIKETYDPKRVFSSLRDG